MRLIFVGCIAVLATLLRAPDLLAQTVYVSRGADGELVFSDQASDDVEQVLELTPDVPAPADPAAAARTSSERVTELLRVADSLAESRLAREQLRTERRAAALPRPAPAVPAENTDAYNRVWFPPLLQPGLPGPGFGITGRYGRPGTHLNGYGRRHPGSGRYDRRDPGLDERLLPGPQPRQGKPLPP